MRRNRPTGGRAWTRDEIKSFAEAIFWALLDDRHACTIGSFDPTGGLKVSWMDKWG